jgi:Tfp pilus assembly PilM family ATPase
MQRIMEDLVRKFNFKLLETNPAKSEDVLAAHYRAQVIAQFYTMLIEKIEQECQINAYTNRKPVVENATELPELQ